MENSVNAAAKVQHVTKASSDELLRKFAEVGSESEDKRELRIVKRRKRIQAAAAGKEAVSFNGGSAVVERKSLLAPAGSKRSAALIRHLGIGKARVRARELRNKSFMGCWKPSRSQYEQMRREAEEEERNYIWSRDLDKHYYGDLSFAIVQANQTLEDYSQYDTGKDVLFAGVYDGHGGAEAANFISIHLLRHIARFAQECGAVNAEVLSNAFTETDKGFLALVGMVFKNQPIIAAHGSCCIVGVIWRGTLYVANLGDSRAVLATLTGSGRLKAEQLNREHNVSYADIREELRSLNPGDEDIVYHRRGAWRIKGVIQVSRSIGDAYLKRQEFALDASYPKYHLPEPLTRPVLRSDPSIFSKNLTPADKFLIIASDGLWDHLSNQQAVDIVNSSPRRGIARELIKAALTEAGRKARMSYEVLKHVRLGERRMFHDDITVFVIFIDHQLMEAGVAYPVLSVKGIKGVEDPPVVNLENGIEVGESSQAGRRSIGQSSQAGLRSIGQSSQTGLKSIGQSLQARLRSFRQSPDAAGKGKGKIGQSSGAETRLVDQSSLARPFGQLPEVAGKGKGKIGQPSEAQSSRAETRLLDQSSRAETRLADQSSQAETRLVDQSSQAETRSVDQSSQAETRSVDQSSEETRLLDQPSEAEPSKEAELPAPAE
nr:probable protein phosphatase 2C 68 [Ipomoea batatas]